MLILAELWDGSTHFNEIRRGVPGISPTLLSRRLKEMEVRGLIERMEDRAKGTIDYMRRPLAIELEEAMTSLGDWAYRNIKAAVALGDPNPDYLMWQMRRTINPGLLPRRRVVVRFRFIDINQAAANYWMIAKPGADVDLCMTDPGYDVDIFVEAEIRALTSAWMGYTSLHDEIEADRIYLSGDTILTRAIDKWLGTCPYSETTSFSDAMHKSATSLQKKGTSF